MTTRQTTLILSALVASAAAFAPELAEAQQYVQQTYPQGQGQAYAPMPGYTYQQTAPQTAGQPALFGVAAYKICEIKNFLFAGVYILGSIAFVIFAIRALFTKFEMKHFIPILGALFVVGTADLFIYWMSEEAFFCPTMLSQLG